MGVVENFLPPACVAYEGRALTVITKLSMIALKLAKIAESIPKESQADYGEVRKHLDEVIEMMSAIHNAYELIQDGANRIIEHLEEGQQTGFLNRGSDLYGISGVISRRKQTLCVIVIGLRKSDAENDNDFPPRDSIVLYKLNERRSRSVSKRTARIAVNRF